MCMQPDLRPVDEDSAGSHGGGRRKAQRQWRMRSMRKRSAPVVTPSMTGGSGSVRWSAVSSVGWGAKWRGRMTNRRSRTGQPSARRCLGTTPSHAASAGRFRRTGRRTSNDGGGFWRAGGCRTGHGGGERLCDGVIVRGELSEEEEDGHLQLLAPVVTLQLESMGD
jgi:hypothetical protein